MKAKPKRPFKWKRNEISISFDMPAQNGVVLAIILILVVAVIPTQSAITLSIAYTAGDWEAQLINEKITLYDCWQVQCFDAKNSTIPPVRYGNIRVAVEIRNSTSQTTFSQEYYISRGSYTIKTFRTANTGDNVVIVIPNEFQKAIPIGR